MKFPQTVSNAKNTVVAKLNVKYWESPDGASRRTYCSLSFTDGGRIELGYYCNVTNTFQFTTRGKDGQWAEWAKYDIEQENK